jgi:nitrite reductase/ring-hydroxylating ferredoxin subunit
VTGPDTFRVTLDDGVYAVPALCPHRGGFLRCGSVNRRRATITCPLHFSTFDLRTGRPISGPACQPLAVTRIAAATDRNAGADQPDRSGIAESDHDRIGAAKEGGVCRE